MSTVTETQTETTAETGTTAMPAATGRTPTKKAVLMCRPEHFTVV